MSARQEEPPNVGTEGSGVAKNKRSLHSVFSEPSSKRLKDSKSDETDSNTTKMTSFVFAQKPASSKVSFGGIKIGLQKSSINTVPKPIPNVLKDSSTKKKIASAFQSDDYDEPEEMPPEAKMRMKNIGRDTPTSAGPNSFGKSRIGFCDANKLYERKLRETEEKIAVQDKKEKS